MKGPEFHLAELADDELVDEDLACQVIGGVHTPIHRSTFWRGIRNGRYPKPLKVSGYINRWRVGELRAVLAKAVEFRDRGPPG